MIYQGEFNEDRDGRGITIIRGIAVIFSHESNQQLHGDSVSISPEGVIVTGTYIRGLLNGPVVSHFQSGVTQMAFYTNG